MNDNDIAHCLWALAAAVVGAIVGFTVCGLEVAEALRKGGACDG